MFWTVEHILKLKGSGQIIYTDVSKNGLAFCIMSNVGSRDLPRPSTTMMANMMDEKLPSSFTLCSINAENRDVIKVDTSI